LFDKIVDELGDLDKPLSNSRLTYLSNLDSAEMARLEEAWKGIGLERRQQIIARLVELAEDNFELNFDSIFIYCLKDEDADVRVSAIEVSGRTRTPR